MKTAKNILHIDIDEVAGYPELLERLSVNAADLDNEDFDLRSELSDIWHDCDYVKTHGELGRGNHMFFVVTEGDTTFIVHYDLDDSDEAISLIDWFLAGAEGDLIGDGGLENTWSDWDKVQSGIAYRGGSGYCYALYAKELGEFTS